MSKYEEIRVQAEGTLALFQDARILNDLPKGRLAEGLVAGLETVLELLSDIEDLQLSILASRAPEGLPDGHVSLADVDWDLGDDNRGGRDEFLEAPGDVPARDPGVGDGVPERLLAVRRPLGHGHVLDVLPGSLGPGTRPRTLCPAPGGTAAGRRRPPGFPGPGGVTLRKIKDYGPSVSCSDPEHFMSSFSDLGPGTYSWTCPRCRTVTAFSVSLVTRNP